MLFSIIELFLFFLLFFWFGIGTMAAGWALQPWEGNYPRCFNSRAGWQVATDLCWQYTGYIKRLVSRCFYVLQNKTKKQFLLLDAILERMKSGRIYHCQSIKCIIYEGGKRWGCQPQLHVGEAEVAKLDLRSHLVAFVLELEVYYV
jgi:hypothetical protein